jgi:carbamoylphosphate synthase large subunit
MNAQATNKPENKANAKPNTTKAVIDQEKAINQLRQEIKNLTKAVKEMQQKPDTQAVIMTMPQELFSRVNVYLSEASKSVGLTMSLSELTCEALNLYLWAEEDNKRLEEEQERAELEKKKGK